VATVEGDITTYRVPWGDQVIAEYVQGLDGVTNLRKRSYWGDGIDDLLVYEWDQDLDGTIESLFHPLTDAQGSVKAVATADGLVVESYIYRPDGSFLIFGLDTTAPQLVLARVRPMDETAGRDTQTIELVFSEQVQQAGGTIEVRNGGGEVVADEATPTDDARRWTMMLDPALIEGESYTMYLSGFEDLAGNAMAAPIEIEFTAPADSEELALPGTSEASILAIIDGPDGLAFVAGAPIDPDSVAASSVTVSRSGNEVTGSLVLVDASTNAAWDGRVLLWTPDDPGAFLAAEYDLVLNFALTDVAGDPIRGPPGTVEFFRNGQGDVVWSKPSEIPLLGGSQVGNDRFLHGRPYIGSLGLYDHRARFYEPGTQLFLEPDPLGPVDSPNLYQAFGFDGMNVVDPFGECLGINDDTCRELAQRMMAVLEQRIAAEPLPEGVKKVERALAGIAFVPITGMLSVGGSEGRLIARGEGIVQGHQPTFRNEEELRNEINEFTLDVVSTVADFAVIGRVTKPVVATVSGSVRLNAARLFSRGKPALPSGYHYRIVKGKPIVVRNPSRSSDLPRIKLQEGQLRYEEEATAAAHQTSLPKQMLGRDYPTKPNRAMLKQPYDSVSGEFLSYQSNVGVRYSPVARFASALTSGYTEAKGGAPQPPLGRSGAVGYAIGYLIGSIF